MNTLNAIEIEVVAGGQVGVTDPYDDDPLPGGFGNGSGGCGPCFPEPIGGGNTQQSK